MIYIIIFTFSYTFLFIWYIIFIIIWANSIICTIIIIIRIYKVIIITYRKTIFDFNGFIDKCQSFDAFWTIIIFFISRAITFFTIFIASFIYSIICIKIITIFCVFFTFSIINIKFWAFHIIVTQEFIFICYMSTFRTTYKTLFIIFKFKFFIKLTFFNTFSFFKNNTYPFLKTNIRTIWFYFIIWK